MKTQFLMFLKNVIFPSLFVLLPITASADYVCTCYVDLRPVGQGLAYKGQVESGTIDAGQYHCKTAYSDATIASCYRSSEDSTASVKPEVSQSLDCIKAPKGIADACLQAFEEEYNPNPGQTELIREDCIRTAISVKLVKACLKKFPLHSTKDEKATYKRLDCIDEAGVGTNRIAFRCPM